MSKNFCVQFNLIYEVQTFKLKRTWKSTKIAAENMKSSLNNLQFIVTHGLLYTQMVFDLWWY